MNRFREDYSDNEDTYRLHTMHTIRSHHFKFEHSGMLVYDSKAIIICGHHTETGIKATADVRKHISPSIKKELDTGDEAGNFLCRICLLLQHEMLSSSSNISI